MGGSSAGLSTGCLVGTVRLFSIVRERKPEGDDWRAVECIRNSQYERMSKGSSSGEIASSDGDWSSWVSGYLDSSRENAPYNAVKDRKSYINQDREEGRAFDSID